jgi:hypothetical protein
MAQKAAKAAGSSSVRTSIYIAGMVSLAKRSCALRAAINIFTLLLSACASYEVAPEVRKADWEAKNVFPVGYKSEILAYLRVYVNDPANVRDAGISEPALKSMGLGNRYVSCVRYASKRTGSAKEHAAVFVGGKLDRFQEIKEANKDLCSGVSYAAFPQLEDLTR